jgi:phenylacetate-CoA ligase
VAKNSPFYKAAFRKHKIDAEKVMYPKDLGNFFTTAEDIRKDPDAFVCAKPDTAYESTGTTSKKTKRVYFSRTEVEEAGWAGAIGLWGLGVRPSDRVVSAFDYSFWVSGPVLVASCKVLGCFHVEAGRITPEEFYERLADYGVTVIVGDPSWLLRLSEIAEKKGAWKIKLMIAGGENFTEDARKYCEKVWKAPFILSYGQTEAFGAIGIESLERKGYHLNGFHNYFEIIDADNQGYGELVYTTINRRVMPLIRYKSGDITRFINEPSKEFPGRRVEKLKGRVDEWTPTALGNIAPWMFEPVFRQVDGIAEDWQIAVSKDGNKDLIEFRMENADGASESVLKDRFFAALKSELPDAWKLSQMELCRLDTRVVPKGSLRAERKLRRIVDTRKF